jgi:CMP-N,N'-diacetyllegionaminic acid synthase
LKILGLIPARGGSKGVPGKNIRALAGKPLIQYTIESALQAAKLTDVIISTDSLDIVAIAERAGAKIPFIRPSELAQDHTPALSVIQHALEWLKTQGDHYDMVCLLQPTSPFRPVGFIDKAITKFLQTEAESLISVLPVPTDYNPHWVFELNERGLLKIATGEVQIIPRRQELPRAYFRDGSIYLTKTEVVLKKNSLYGDAISYIEMDNTYHVNIDTMADWEQAEKLAFQYLKESNSTKN